MKILVQENARGFGMSVPSLPGISAQGESYQTCLASLRTLLREKLLADPLDTVSLPGRLTVVPLEPPPE